MSKRSFNQRLSSGQADLCRLIVSERTGRWTVALKRELRGCHVRVYQARSLSECWNMLAQYPAAFLVIEVARSNLGVLPGRLSEIESRFPSARVAMVGDRDMAEHEFLFREAGAIHFTTSTRSLHAFAIVAQNHFKHLPKPTLSLVESIWDSLPWED